MSIKKKINSLRSAFFGVLTRRIGQRRNLPTGGSIQASSIRSVLVCRPNHRLGNQLLITPLIQEISTTFPQAKIDLFVKGNIARTLFKEYDCIDTVFQLPKKPFKDIISYLRGWLQLRRKKYDLVINVISSSSSGRLSAKFARGRIKFFGDVSEQIKNSYPDSAHMAAYPVYHLRENLERLGLAQQYQGVPPLSIKLTPWELTEGAKILRNISESEKPVICIYTFATGAKCYDKQWWSAFYQELLLRFSQYTIIEILPVENVSQIDFKAPHYYSTDLRMLAAIIKSTEIFIGADSGMMHLSSAAGATTLGLFKVTDLNAYTPYGNFSTAVNTNKSEMEKIFSTIDSILLTRKQIIA